MGTKIRQQQADVGVCTGYWRVWCRTYDRAQCGIVLQATVSRQVLSRGGEYVWAGADFGLFVLSVDVLSLIHI